MYFGKVGREPYNILTMSKHGGLFLKPFLVFKRSTAAILAPQRMNILLRKRFPLRRASAVPRQLRSRARQRRRDVQRLAQLDSLLAPARGEDLRENHRGIRLLANRGRGVQRESARNGGRVRAERDVRELRQGGDSDGGGRVGVQQGAVQSVTGFCRIANYGRRMQVHGEIRAQGTLENRKIMFREGGGDCAGICDAAMLFCGEHSGFSVSGFVNKNRMVVLLVFLDGQNFSVSTWRIIYAFE